MIEKKRPKFATALEQSCTRKAWGCAEGKARYDGFWNMVERIEDTYLRLSVQQRHIIEEFVRSCIVKIVGDTFQVNYASPLSSNVMHLLTCTRRR